MHGRALRSGNYAQSVAYCSCPRMRAQRGYDGEWLGGTFSRAVFVGNGLVAILAGLIAHSLVETLALGPVAPFDAVGVASLFWLPLSDWVNPARCNPWLVETLALGPVAPFDAVGATACLFRIQFFSWLHISTRYVQCGQQCCRRGGRAPHACFGLHSLAGNLHLQHVYSVVSSAALPIILYTSWCAAVDASALAVPCNMGDLGPSWGKGLALALCAQAGVVMLAGGAIVALTWTENYGDTGEKKNFLEQLRNGAHAIYNGGSLEPLQNPSGQYTSFGSCMNTCIKQGTSSA